MCRHVVHLIIVAVLLATPLYAQGHAMHSLESTSDPHLRTTAVWPPRQGDAARADAILSIAREALGKYRDVRMAVEDGYRRFAADVPNPRIYHYTRLTAVVKARP